MLRQRQRKTGQRKDRKTDFYLAQVDWWWWTSAAIQWLKGASSTKRYWNAKRQTLDWRNTFVVEFIVVRVPSCGNERNTITILMVMLVSTEQSYKRKTIKKSSITYFRWWMMILYGCRMRMLDIINAGWQKIARISRPQNEEWQQKTVFRYPNHSTRQVVQGRLGCFGHV